jgi:hypothetical protein
MRESAGLDTDPGSLGRAVSQVDAWRQRAIGAGTADGAYKEWMHYCVRLPGVPGSHLLLNLNVSERRLGGRVRRVPRLMLLAATDTWRGSLESFADEQVSTEPGSIDIRVGDNQVRWQGGAFHLSVRTAEIGAELVLRPLVHPTISSCVSFGGGRLMHWVVIPRLEASGWVRVADRRFQLERALAYHDHNWGQFRWGADLSWEWGFVNPDDPACPWSVVFVRVSDDKRGCALGQGLLVWGGRSLRRTFQNHELRMTLEGVDGGPRPFTLPSIAGLLVPGAASGVPAQVRVEAGGGREHVRVQYRTETKARVALPSDVDPFRIVSLNETCGQAHVSGTVGAGTFEFSGSAVMEFVRG